MFNKNKENILIIKTDNLAGFVAAEPLFHAIREAHPDAVISLLTARELERLARAAPYFDQIAPLPRMEERIARQSLYSQLKRSKFTRIYDLCCDENSRKINAGLGLFKPKWYSVEAARTRQAKRQGGIAVPGIEKFTQALGLEAPERKPDFSWALAARKDSANMQPSWYGLSGPYGLLLVSREAEYRWPAERYGDLANHMANHGIIPVLIGDHELQDFGDDISLHAPSLVDLTGKSDHLQLAALAGNANFFVSDHADEMYMALSMGCNGVILSGYDDPEIHRSGCHVVRIDVDGDPSMVAADQVWKTVQNMGLTDNHNHDPHKFDREIYVEDLNHSQ